MFSWIKRGWKAYTDWCDCMGLTPENRRCCAPRLEEPELDAKREVQSCTKPTGQDHISVSSDDCFTKNATPGDGNKG